MRLSSAPSSFLAPLPSPEDNSFSIASMPFSSAATQSVLLNPVYTILHNGLALGQHVFEPYAETNRASSPLSAFLAEESLLPENTLGQTMDPSTLSMPASFADGLTTKPMPQVHDTAAIQADNRDIFPRFNMDIPQEGEAHITAVDGITDTHSSTEFLHMKKTDTETGLHRKTARAVSRSNFYQKVKVDPLTGQISNLPNAISRSAYEEKKKVDPHTGRISIQADAISRTLYKSRRKVDPLTGKRSEASDAVSYSNFKNRQKVDPLTGIPSTQQDAISITAFRKRKRVDPETGQPSINKNAISYTAYNQRKKVDPETGAPSIAKNAIRRSIFAKRQQKMKKQTTNLALSASSQ